MWMTVAYVFDALYYSLIDFGDLQIGIWPWVSLYQKRLRPFSFRKKNPIEIISERESVSCSVMSSSLRPMDCSLPGFSVHGILQARLLEWLAIPFSRGSSQPWDWTQTSCTEGSFYTIWTTREAQRLIRVNVYWAFPVSHCGECLTWRSLGPASLWGIYCCHLQIQVGKLGLTQVVPGHTAGAGAGTGLNVDYEDGTWHGEGTQ